MRRLVLVLICLVFQAFAPAWAKGQRVWVALSGPDAHYLEAAHAVRSRLPEQDVSIRPWEAFVGVGESPPRVVVAIGVEATNRMIEASANWPKTTLVALLVPRAILERLAEERRGRATGVYFDQPFERQARLLRLAVPEKRRIGLLLGPASRRYESEIRQTMRRAGLEVVSQIIEQRDDLSTALREVLSGADVLLAIPDNVVHNSQSAHPVLLASYRQGIPVLGYSASFVKAGAALALLSAPEQVGRQGGDLVADLLAGGDFPAPAAPEEFLVMVNGGVARSLDLDLDGEALEKRLASRRRMP